MLTVRRNYSADHQVQGGEPWRIFWAGAPPFSLVEKIGGAYTFPQPRLMFGRQTLISNEGQAQHRDDANLQRTLSPLSLAPTSQASSPQGEPFSGAMRVSFFLQRCPCGPAAAACLPPWGRWIAHRARRRGLLSVGNCYSGPRKKQRKENGPLSLAALDSSPRVGAKKWAHPRFMPTAGKILRRMTAQERGPARRRRTKAPLEGSWQPNG